MPPRKRPAHSDPLAAPEIARAYIRVSRQGDRGEEGKSDFISPDLQLSTAAAYCTLHRLHLDTDVSRLHSDIDVSGFRKRWSQRPGLAAHLEAAKRGEFKHLIVYKLSRLARNAQAGLEIFDEFDRLGVTIHVVKEGIDTSTAVGRMIRTMLLAVAEMQSEDASQFVADAIRQKVARGIPHGKLPWWVTRGEGGALTLDEAAASAMRRLVELRLEGHGHVHVARQMNAEGYRTARGNSWSVDLVNHYLALDYIDRMEGSAVYGRQSGRRGFQRGPVEGEGRIPGAFPRLIDAETAAALRRVMERHLAKRAGAVHHMRKRGPQSETPFLASSLAYCGLCGGRMHSNYRTHGERTYVCNAGRFEPLGERHGDQNRGVVVSASALEDAVARVCRRALGLGPPPAPPKPKRAAGGRDLSGQLRQVQERIERFVGSSVVLGLEQTEYDRLLGDLLAERARLQEEAQREDAPSVYARAQSLLGGGGDEQKAWRSIFLELIERIDVPVYIEGEKRRCVRVTLTHPTREGRVFIAPMYVSRWAGARRVIPADDL